MLDHFPVSKATLMKGQLVLLRRLLRAIRSAKDFKELGRTIVFTRRWKDGLSRSDRLMLLREIINSKTRTYV